MATNFTKIPFDGISGDVANEMKRLPGALDSHHLRLSVPVPDVDGDSPPDISLA